MQAGTEAFDGTAVYVTSQYSVAITTPDDVSSTTSSAVSTSSKKSSSTKSSDSDTTTTSTEADVTSTDADTSSSSSSSTAATSSPTVATVNNDNVRCRLRKPSSLLQSRALPVSPADYFAAHRKRRRRSTFSLVLDGLWPQRRT